MKLYKTHLKTKSALNLFKYRKHFQEGALLFAKNFL